MRHIVDPSGSIDALATQLDTLSRQGAKGIMVLACDANGFEPPTLDPVLQACEVPVFGGIFPQVLHGAQRLEKGTVLLGFFEHAPVVQVIERISDPQTELSKAVGEMDDSDFHTMFVFVDAFSTTIDQLISELYFEFGLEHNFVGGGAGSLSFESRPVVITPRGLLMDAVVTAHTEGRCSIGVSHGWTRVDGPFQITKATGNTIQELDFKPAFLVYRGVIEARTDCAITGDNFFEIAKAFPFGIQKLGSENVVRDPVSVDDNGALVCVGNVHEGDFVEVLSGDNDSLVAAARAAGEAARQGGRGNGTVFIDCISRVLFLEDDFQRELDAVADGSEDLVGALTLGEIANYGQEYLEFYNKTAVVAAF